MITAALRYLARYRYLGRHQLIIIPPQLDDAWSAALKRMRPLGQYR